MGSSLFFKQGFLDSQKLFLPLVIWACSCVASNSLCQAYPIVSPISFRFRAGSFFLLWNWISSITTGCYCLLATHPISRNYFPFFYSKTSRKHGKTQTCPIWDPIYERKWTCSLKSRENASGDGRLEGEDRKALLLKHGDSFSGKKKERQSSTTFSRSRSLNGTLS